MVGLGLGGWGLLWQLAATTTTGSELYVAVPKTLSNLNDIRTRLIPIETFGIIINLR